MHPPPQHRPTSFPRSHSPARAASPPPCWRWQPPPNRPPAPAARAAARHRGRPPAAAASLCSGQCGGPEQVRMLRACHRPEPGPHLRAVSAAPTWQHATLAASPPFHMQRPQPEPTRVSVQVALHPLQQVPELRGALQHAQHVDQVLGRALAPHLGSGGAREEQRIKRACAAGGRLQHTEAELQTCLGGSPTTQQPPCTPV